MTVKELYNRGYAYHINGNYTEAANCFKEAWSLAKHYTDDGVPETMYMIATYLYGDIGFEGDVEAAKGWLDDLLKYHPKHSGALWLRGHICCEEGDYSQAFYFLNKGADLGNHSCMAELSFLYMEGDGVEEDGNKAYQLAVRATYGAGGIGEYALASLYYRGAKGFKRDTEWAEMYAKNAIRHGCEQAQEVLDSIENDKKRRTVGVAKAIGKAVGGVVSEQAEDYLSDYLTSLFSHND